MVKYSFIIPVKEINAYIREAVPKILAIEREDYEIIIYPDQVTDEQWEKTRQIASGPGGPAMKRGLAIRDAAGDFLVFIDDDAYPRVDFLDVLDEDFSDPSVAAVGGPALTPPDDSFLQKVSGAVFLSEFSGGFPERYVPFGEKRFVVDWPTVNLTVRKKMFTAIGGFDCNYWPGEDTKFCLDLVSRFKERNKILYDPRLIVWHHRREGLGRHLRQVGGYGLHRGFFAKKFPETSFKLRYFVPSLFVLFVLGGALLSFFSLLAGELYLVGWLFYLAVLVKVFFDILRHQKEKGVAAYALVYIFFTHLVYGIMFFKGFLFTRTLKSKLR